MLIDWKHVESTYDPESKECDEPMEQKNEPEPVVPNCPLCGRNDAVVPVSYSDEIGWNCQSCNREFGFTPKQESSEKPQLVNCGDCVHDIGNQDCSAKNRPFNHARGRYTVEGPHDCQYFSPSAQARIATALEKICYLMAGGRNI